MVFTAQKVARTTAFVPTLLLAVTLGACGGSDNDEVPQMDGQVDEIRPGLVVSGLNGAPAEDLISPWLGLMRLFQNTSFSDASEMSVSLLRFDDGFTLNDVIEFYTLELDTCQITELDSTGGGGNGNSASESISGGVSVTINTGSGPWLEMGRPDTSDPGFYMEPTGELGALPADATLSIPGEGFPNVPAYALLDQPSAPVRLSPDFGVLTEADVTAPFAWIPEPARPGGYIQIFGIAFDAAGNFQGFPVRCRVIDDGEFVLPQNVIDAFSDSEFEFETRFERVVARLDLINGIVFHQGIRVVE